jgi:viologen exporter family transport system ATP-binding protein
VPKDKADDAAQKPSQPTTLPRAANSAANPAAITVVGLTKEVKGRRGSTGFRLGRKPRIRAVDAVSFTISAGSAVGYVGPAGSGKTTLVELLTGETTATAGTIDVLGLRPDTEREQLLRRIGIVSGRHPRLWPDLSLEESLRMLAEAHGLSDSLRLARRAELVERLDLRAFIALPVGDLSPGRRSRAEVAAAVLHEPELLILDEPMAGLDVVGKDQLRTFLHDENRQHRRTLLMTTAALADVEQVCDRLLVSDRGRTVHDGDLADLISRAGVQRTLVVNLTEPDRILDDVPGAKLIGVEADGLRQRLTFTPGSIPASRVLADVASRVGVRNLTLEEPDLDDLIRRL